MAVKALKKTMIIQERCRKILEMATNNEMQAEILLERAKQLRERVEAIETGAKPIRTKYRELYEQMELEERRLLYDHLQKKMERSRHWVYMSINLGPSDRFRYRFDMHFDYMVRLLGYKQT